MSTVIEILAVNLENAERLGFTCYKSKPDGPGYQRRGIRYDPSYTEYQQRTDRQIPVVILDRI